MNDWLDYLQKTAASSSSALAADLLGELSIREDRRRLVEHQLDGWNLAVGSSSSSSSSPAASKKIVWTPARELNCYVIYTESDRTRRCRRAKIGLFHEIANIVMGLVIDDICVCAALSISELRTLRCWRGTFDVSSICAEDLINAANVSATQLESKHGETNVSCGNCPRKLECMPTRGDAGRPSQALKGQGGWESNSLEFRHQTTSSDIFSRDTQLELVFVDGTVIGFAFQTGHGASTFCEFITLVSDFHTIPLINEVLSI